MKEYIKIVRSDFRAVATSDARENSSDVVRILLLAMRYAGFLEFRYIRGFAGSVGRLTDGAADLLHRFSMVSFGTVLDKANSLLENYWGVERIRCLFI